MKVKILVNLKPEILDPQGEAILRSLQSLGFNNINKVRQGKVIEIDIDDSNKDKVSEQAKKMCEKLLSNAVIEDYKVEFI